MAICAPNQWCWEQYCYNLFVIYLINLIYQQGIPYIEQERNAAETVIEFAIKHLKFSPKSIILYGWSIGGFASTHLAQKYPDVHAVVNMQYTLFMCLKYNYLC